MANNLTGAYDAVLLVRLRQVNALIAAVHQARIAPDASPGFPHSVRVQIGSPSLVQATDVVRFREWAVQVGAGLPTGSTVKDLVTRSLPPGVASFYEQAWHRLDSSLLEPPTAGAVHGEAEVQISSPSITVPPGTSSEVVVSTHIRARYHAAVGSAALPEFIHGEVRARYRAVPKMLPAGKTVLQALVSSNDSHIEFIPAPGSGATPADVQRILVEIRKALRTQFTASDVELPVDFKVPEFKTLGSGSDEALVLPFGLSGTPPLGQLGSITNSFLGSAEFAFAISKDAFQVHFGALTDSLKAAEATIHITASGLFGTAHYDPAISNLAFTWKSGLIAFSGRADFTTSTALAPNGFITFSQDLALALDPASGRVSLEAAGEPSVDESWWLSHGRAVNIVKAALKSALESGSPALHKALDGARGTLANALRGFDKHASARSTGVEITPDGVVLRGSIIASGRIPPVVEYQETEAGTLLSAFTSWIPGGRIHSYEWTWVELTHVIPWFNKTQTREETHRFVSPKTASMARASRVCVRVHGSRRDADGHIEDPVIAGEGCRVSAHEPILVVPPWAFEAVVPIWRVDPPPDAILADAITGHINVATGGRPPGALTANALVHFAGERFENTLAHLARAIDAGRRPETALMMFLILPQGALRARRDELERRLGPATERFGADLTITEDYGGGWARIFGARAEEPSSHLLNARGELAWADAGRLDPERLGHALRAHLMPAPPPATVALRLAVERGDPFRQLVLTDVDGSELSLERFRGLEVVLVFWQSWSEPSIRELRRLDARYRGWAERVVVGIHGGDDRTAVAAVRREYNISIPLVADIGGTLAARIGIHCWPTVITLGADGTLASAAFGEHHQHGQHEKAD